ncbi:MAG: RluA family pseudouridine synthase [Candidatus Omnitrophica bacterium]|nr:RluA family pseudouridine synthase [Candidatus Omnitrophota bacterium]
MLRTIRVVYEDAHLLVVEKPAGMLTVATVKNERGTLVNILRDEGYRVYPCHRLDRDTSGLIMFAKDKNTLDKMRQQFREHNVRKAYKAIVQGSLQRKGGTISYDIIEKGVKKPARTDYVVLESNPLFTLAEVRPLTGRTNQIRIHFKQIGHPLVGERKFFLAKRSGVKFRRAALHAERLDFRHPYTGEKIRLRSALPKDMENFLRGTK